MTPNEYQALAGRTECDQEASRSRMVGGLLPGDSLLPIRLNHAAIGLGGEAGELLGAVERWLYYGKPLSRLNVIEELGDAMWYIALACNALGVKLEDVMSINIKKLQARYPDKYDGERAAEENRDRAAERRVMNETIPDLWMVCSICRQPIFQAHPPSGGVLSKSPHEWRHEHTPTEPGICPGGEPIDTKEDRV